MPKLSDVVEKVSLNKKTKKMDFKPTKYRQWDFSPISTNQKTEIKNSNQTVIDSLSISNQSPIDRELKGGQPRKSYLNNFEASMLGPIAKEILMIVLENEGMKISPRWLSEQIKTTKESIKTSTYRLRRHGWLISELSKGGVSGGNFYRLREDVKAALLLEKETVIKPLSNSNQTVIDSLSISNQSPNILSSSSSNNKTTTTRAALDNCSLDQHSFTDDDLAQLLRKCDHDVERAQASLRHFAYELRQRDDIKAPKRWFFKFINEHGYYPAPDGYKTPEQRWEEERLKQLQAAQRLREQREQLEFDEWLATLSEADKQAKVPESTWKMGLQGAIEAELKKIWRQEAMTAPTRAGA